MLQFDEEAIAGYLSNNLHDFKLDQESQVSTFKYNSWSGGDLGYWANSVKWRRIVGVFVPISWSENLGFTNCLQKHTGLLSCSAYDTSLIHTLTSVSSQIIIIIFSCQTSSKKLKSFRSNYIYIF